MQLGFRATTLQLNRRRHHLRGCRLGCRFAVGAACSTEACCICRRPEVLRLALGSQAAVKSGLQRELDVRGEI